jgi:hypothetical protein
MMGVDDIAELKNLSREQLETMAEAADQILECYRLLGKSGENIVAEVLRGEGEFFEWDHYPKGDVYDHVTHAQYYYHAHPAGLRGDEHGHFHTFLRPKGMPKELRPKDLPDLEPAKDPNDALSHLVAISMNRAGFPVRLFTTNRWVTGETWYDADDVIAMMDHFVIDLARPSLPVNIWITAMLRLFRPHIERLLRDRDAAVAEHQARQAGENVYEDRNLEVTSMADISVESQVKGVQDALSAAPRRGSGGAGTNGSNP